MRIAKLTFLSILLISLSGLFGGCYKKEKTIVKILVRDVNNLAVSSATVKLIAVPSPGQPPSEPNNYFPRTAKSNSSGVAEFDLTDVYKSGSAGVAVLNIEATTPNGASGQGIVKAEQEKTVLEVVYVQ